MAAKSGGGWKWFLAGAIILLVAGGALWLRHGKSEALTFNMSIPLGEVTTEGGDAPAASPAGTEG